MYMSYCRHEGTFAELKACLGDAEEHVNGEAPYDVSEHEINQFKRMVEFFYGWMMDMSLIDENGELDEGALDEICESMTKGYDEEDTE